MEAIVKTICSRKSFLMNLGIDVCRFLEALGADCLVFWALERFENRGFVVMQTDPEKLNWGRRYTGYLGPLRT